MKQPPALPQTFIAPDTGLALPALFAPDPAAARRFIEFFTANIRNPNTRKAYARAVSEFATWCDQHTLYGNCAASSRCMSRPISKVCSNGWRPLP